MAQLYRRVRRLSDRGRLASLIVFFVGSLVAGPASADETLESPSAGLMITTSADIRATATGLGDTDPAVRERALARLTSLPSSALPAVEDRLTEMRQERVRSVLADIELTAMTDLAEAAVPGRSEDEVLDMYPGVLARLESHRSTAAIRMAERFALLRGLEGIGSPEAGSLILQIIGRDYRVWRWEAARVALRMGLRLLPTFVSARGHPNPGVHRWGVFHARRLGAHSAGEAVHLVDSSTLPALLRAYAAVRDMGAMTIIVSYLADRRIATREAARASLEPYGQNAIWQLRRAYRNSAGEAPPSSWSAPRLLNELWSVLDTRRFASGRAIFDEAQAALQAGDYSTARRLYGELLARHASPPVSSEVAQGYALIGANALEDGEYALGAWSFGRAIRLDPDAASRDRWQARLDYAKAEQSLAHGVVDVDGYETALSLDANLREASERLEGLADGGYAPVEERRKWAGTGAAGLLFFLAAGIVRRRRDPVGPEEDALEPEAADDTRPAI